MNKPDFMKRLNSLLITSSLPSTDNNKKGLKQNNFTTCTSRVLTRI